MGERLNGIQEVSGSIPLASIPVRFDRLTSLLADQADWFRFSRKYCGNSSVGRAQPCQGWGRGFESRFPLHLVVDLAVH